MVNIFPAHLQQGGNLGTSVEETSFSSVTKPPLAVLACFQFADFGLKACSVTLNLIHGRRAASS